LRAQVEKTAGLAEGSRRTRPFIDAWLAKPFEWNDLQT
jgi:hypothetical protein